MEEVQKEIQQTGSLQMNFFLHCVLARQGHSDRVALNISNTGLFWVVTKFSLFWLLH